MAETFQVHVIRRVRSIAEEEKSPGDAIRVDADSKGRVLFRDQTETVSADLFDSSFRDCVAMAKKMIERASEIAKDFRVDSITLKLGLDGKLGCVFIGDASLEASIEVEIKNVKSGDGGGT